MKEDGSDLGDAIAKALGQNPKKKTGRLCYKPNTGWARNPMADLPRNIECPCGSLKKFKKCCLPLTKSVVTEEALPAYREMYEKVLKDPGPHPLW